MQVFVHSIDDGLPFPNCMHTKPLQAFIVHAQQNMEAYLFSLKAVSIHLYKAKLETDKLDVEASLVAGSAGPVLSVLICVRQR